MINTDETSGIVERQALRFRILQWFYEQALANRAKFHIRMEIPQILGINSESLQDAITYLHSEGLLEPLNGDSLGVFYRISHFGYKEVEVKLMQPDRPTEHFSFNVITIHSMVGSQIQQGTLHSQQTGTFHQADREAITDIINQLRAIIPDPGLGDEDREELRSEVDTVDAQLRSPRPKRPIINACLESAKAILIGAAGNLLADPSKVQAIITAIDKTIGMG